MRIAISGQTYYPGNNGQAIFTIHLAEGLARAGHEVAVIVPAPDFSYRVETIQQVQVHQVHSIPLNWIHNGTFLNAFSAAKIAEIFRQFRPDVLHIQDHYFLELSAVQVARRMHIPILGTNHFLPENLLPYLMWLPLPRSWKVRFLWETMLMTYRKVNLVTTPTRTAAGILGHQKLGVPIIPISCGVNTDLFCPQPVADRAALRKRFGLDADARIFLYVGRQDREKRVDLPIRALAELLRSDAIRERGEVQLAIAGQGSAAAEFHALAATLGVEDRVKFLGYVPGEQLPDLYRVCDVFCMPSPEELQSIATLEAMASGKPVLAANARALPELVSPGENGQLFTPGSVSSLMQAMTWALEQQSEWQQMASASRIRAEHHSLHNTLIRYLEQYQKLAAFPSQ